MIFLLFNIFLQQALANEEQIRTSRFTIPATEMAGKIEVQQILVPKDQLAETIQGIIKNESHVYSVVVSEEAMDSSARQDLQEDLKKDKIPLREFSEADLEKPENAVSITERNGMRMLLVIRCLGFGAGLYATGASLPIVAFAGIFNYAMIEALYIPNHKGEMRGIQIVNQTIDRAMQWNKKFQPNLSYQQIKQREYALNVISNYTLNVAMLIPFLGMTASDFPTYLESFLHMETYIRAIAFAIPTTFLLSSWKMAMTRWEEVRVEKGYNVPNKKIQSRLINASDFINSFFVAGFWNMQPTSIFVVVANGVSGLLAMTYYDFQSKIVRPRACRMIFN